MIKLLAVMLSLVAVASAVDLPSKKTLNLAAIKVMVAAAEAEMQKQNVEVTILIVDESGNTIFLQKADKVSLNTLEFARRKARHALFYRSPSRMGAESYKKGNTEVMSFPDYSPTRVDCRYRSTATPSAPLPVAEPSPRLTKQSHRRQSTPS